MLIMALGYLARCSGVIGANEVQKMNGAAFKFMMPFMLYYNIYKSDLTGAFDPMLLLFAIICFFVIFFSCVFLAKKIHCPQEQRGVIAQGLYRSNFVIIGIPLAQNLLPEGTDIGSVVVLVAVIVPLFNMVSVIVLEMFSGKSPNAKKLAKDIITNPLILGTLAGVITVLLGIKLPEFITSTLKQIAAATSPLLLFLLGAFFSFDGLHKCLKPTILVTIGRLIIVPGIVLAAAIACGFRGVALAGLLGAFGSANAIASFAMTQQLGGDAELAGNIIVLTSAGCIVTLFLWSMLLKTFGLI
jgi:malate permease and related proteins